MSSGKQLSFAFGEVDPSLRFRVDGSFYAQGLRRAKNGIVLKTGGFANRAGFEYRQSQILQDFIPNIKGKAGTRLIPFEEGGRKFIVAIQDHIKGYPAGWDTDPLADGDWIVRDFIQVYDQVTGLALTQTLGAGIGLIHNQPTDTLVPIESINYTVLGGALVINFGKNFSVNLPKDSGNPFDPYNNVSSFVVVVNPTADEFFFSDASFRPPTPIGAPVSGLTGSGSGLTADIIGPVSYRIYQERWDGVEALWGAFAFDLYHPNNSVTSFLTCDEFPSVFNQVKNYNVYRSIAYKKIDDSIVAANTHALVARIRPAGPNFFIDYLRNPDNTITEPEDMRFTFARYTHLVYHQERACLVPQTDSGLFPKGTVIVSKLGSPFMLARPLVPQDADAFAFTIPNKLDQDITNMVSAKRLLLFTKRETIMIRGGENGILAPLQLNPEIIAFQGSSNEVNPATVSSKVFYLNFDRSKLMMVDFISDEQVEVKDVSNLGSHLFAPKDIVDMAVTSNATEVLWMLKRDGTLISLSFSDEGIAAFATHEIAGGFIESMTNIDFVKEKILNDDDFAEGQSLAVTVIRDGARSIEYLNEREDQDSELWVYADAFSYFGTRLKFLNAEGVYSRGILGQDARLNLTTATTFEAGEEITLTNLDYNALDASTYFLNNVDPTRDRIDFIYDVADPTTGREYESSARFIKTGTISFGQITGYFEEDLPVFLQDVETADPSDKLARQTRWVISRNEFTGFTHLANKEVSVYADGRVISSPLNPTMSDNTLTVANDGTLTLPEFIQYGVVGLPYETELETLDLEASDQRTFTDVGKLIGIVGIGLQRTKGGFVGQTDKELTSMEQYLIREDEFLEQATETFDGHLKVNFPANWEQTGRVKIKQVDPLPMTVLAVYPKGVIGD